MPETAHDSSAPSDVPSLSLVIPAFNEAPRLAAGFARLQAAIADGAIAPDTTQFILVDDGSEDDTSACAADLLSGLPHTAIVRLPHNRGKGAAVRAGVAASTGTTVVFADADMAIDPRQMPKFLDALGRTDLAIGSRAAIGASVDRPSIRRSVMNRTFNLLVNAVSHLSIDDTQCGFKAFRGPLARLLFHCSTTERMAFDVEILTLARRLGLSISQVPVHWSRVEGSRVRSWSDSRSMVGDVLRARQRLAAAPSVPSLTVTIGSSRSDLAPLYLQSLSASFPVLSHGPDQYLVLFPLLDERQVAESVRTISAQLALTERSAEPLPFQRLQALMPQALIWAGGAVPTHRTPP